MLMAKIKQIKLILERCFKLHFRKLFLIKNFLFLSPFSVSASKYYPSANQVALGEQDVLHTNAHNQWHEHVQESRLWHNVSCAAASDAATTIVGNNAATIRRIVTNGSHQEAEKLHDPDIAATLNQHYQLQHHHHRHPPRQQQNL